jgi:hypothetical protein
MILIAFNALNQSFFMGLFFYLSGRFTQKNLDRTTLKPETKNAQRIRFIRGRILRILLPAIFYTMFLHPALDVLKYICGRYVGLGSHSMTTNWATQIVLIYMNSWTAGGGIKGPVWYLGLLFIFDTLSIIAAVYVRSSQRNSARIGRARTSKAPLLHFYLLVVLSSCTIRMFYPIGTTLPIFSIQPGYLPQYVFAYIVGRLSVVYDDVLLLDVFPRRYGPKLQLALSIVFQLVMGLAVADFTVRTGGAVLGEELIPLLVGGLNLPALLYAAWNELGMALISPGLIALFVTHMDFPIYLGYSLPRLCSGRNGMTGLKNDAKSEQIQSSPRPPIARYSYAAFLVHPLVSLALEILVDGMCGNSAQLQKIWKLLGPVVLTVLVGAMNIAASWAVAWLLCHYIPCLGRIL